MWSWRQLADLVTAMSGAYTPDSLNLLLLSLDRRLDHFAGPNDALPTALRKVALAARTEGWIGELVDAVARDRPDNPEVQAWLAGHHRPAEPADAALERTVHHGEPKVDLVTHVEQLGRLAGQVCRIQYGRSPAEPLGTGFLIGPDLCLTNCHVLQPVRDGTVAPDEVRLVFDHVRVGETVRPGVPYRLADRWQVAVSPSSPVDLLARPDGRLPDPGEADMVVVRIAGRPGDDRGWVHRRRRDPVLPEIQLRMVQYPGEHPLKVAYGRAIGLNANRTRLRHSVNTEGGSSGAPVFDSHLRLVAVHVAGDPDRTPGRPAAFNVAVPVDAVRDALAGQGVDAEILR